MILRQTLPEVSVVVPAHNEAENLAPLVDEIVTALDSGESSYEIVVIDDASTDATPDVLERLGDRYGCLRSHRLSRQSGQSAALAHGFALAGGALVVTIDADLQNDPADIPALLERLADADGAIGWRRDRKDPWSKRIISKLANAVRNWATGESVRDTGCGLKAFRRECLEPLPRFDGMHRFLPTLVKMHGRRVVEVPVNHRPRVRGRTHYNLFNRSIRPMIDLLGVRWLQRRAIAVHVEEHALVER